LNKIFTESLRTLFVDLVYMNFGTIWKCFDVAETLLWRRRPHQMQTCADKEAAAVSPSVTGICWTQPPNGKPSPDKILCLSAFVATNHQTRYFRKYNQVLFKKKKKKVFHRFKKKNLLKELCKRTLLLDVHLIKTKFLCE